MKLGLVTAAALAVATLFAGGAADAAQGCGPGFHRGFYGVCRPNGFGFYGRPFYGAYHPYGWGWHHWGWHRGWHRW